MGEIRKDTIDELERLVGCRSPEQGLGNVREDAGGRLVALSIFTYSNRPVR